MRDCPRVFSCQLFALRFRFGALDSQCHQTRSRRPARLSPQETTVYCDLLPNAQCTDRPSKQFHVTTRMPAIRTACITRKRVTHSLLPSVYSDGLSSALCPASTRIQRYRSYQTLFTTIARGHRLSYSLRIAWKGCHITV